MKSKWLKVGDVVTSPAGMIGTVMKVRKDTNMPFYVVRWNNGVTGRHGLCSGLKKSESRGKSVTAK